MKLQTLALLAPVLAIVALGLVAIRATQPDANGPAGLASESTAMDTTPPQSEDARPEDTSIAVRTSPRPRIAKAIAAVEADALKPRFTGLLGEFHIVGPSDPFLNFACDSYPTRPTATEMESSELYLRRPLLGSREGAMCDGTVYVVGGTQLIDDDESTDIDRGYYQGPKPQASRNAPLDRLTVTTIGGRPALVEQARQELFPECRLLVIERTPTPSTPGIFMDITGNLECATAVELAARILLELYGP
ncbi:MAG: hypothetical protein WEB00_14090 [Dehalococcoidia bacterium]